MLEGPVLQQGARLIAIGLGVGLLGAGALSRVFQAQLFGVSAIDPLTYGTVALGLGGLAIAA